MKYSTSNTILHIEMSIVNLKLIFVKKQSTHAQLKAEARHSLQQKWPFSHYRRIIRVRWVIRLMTRVRKVIRLNLKME